MLLIGAVLSDPDAVDEKFWRRWQQCSTRRHCCFILLRVSRVWHWRSNGCEQRIWGKSLLPLPFGSLI